MPKIKQNLPYVYVSVAIAAAGVAGFGLGYNVALAIVTHYMNKMQDVIDSA